MHELEPLSPFEQRVVDAARDGKVADLSAGDEAYNNPLEGDQWVKEREIRAQLIYALSTGSNPNWPVHAEGVRVKGASIVGALDFEAANVKCPLSLERCCILEQIIFKHASVSSFDLSGSFAAMGIDADGMRADRDVVLAAGFIAKGEVSLSYATLGGVLRCDGGSFVNEAGIALNADRIDVRGDIFLRFGFSAKGEVRLLGARIGGDLQCDAGSFVNEVGVALNADRIEVNGDIFLRSGFSAKGEVRLRGAKIGGTLDCHAGSFENGRLVALASDRVDVRGDILLCNGFSAKGAVRLPGAKIGGDLDCGAGSFEKAVGSWLRPHRIGNALSAGRIDIKGGIFMDRGFSASEAVDLQHAHVGVLFDNEREWPPELWLNGFTYDAIYDDAIYGAGLTVARTRLKWLKRPPGKEFQPQPYEQLASVLRRMGLERDAREISFAKQVALRDSDQLSDTGWLWSWLLRVTIGYGYRFWIAFIWAAASLLVGTVVALYAHGRGNLRTDPDAQSNVQTAGGGELDEYLHAVFYSLNATLPSPSADLSAVPWQLKEQGQNDRWYWVFEAWFLFQRVFGWLLAGLMIAAASGLIKKE